MLNLEYGQLAAQAVIQILFVGLFVWFFKSYLPQQRKDFTEQHDRQRADLLTRVDAILEQFHTDLQREQEIHKTVQSDAYEVIRESFSSIKCDLDDMTAQMGKLSHNSVRFERQLGRLLTVMIAAVTDNASEAKEILDRIDRINNGN